MNESVLLNWGLYRQGRIENPTFRTIAKHLNRIVAREFPSAFVFRVYAQANITSQFSFALLDSHHRNINKRFLSNLRFHLV